MNTEKRVRELGCIRSWADLLILTLICDTGSLMRNLWSYEIVFTVATQGIPHKETQLTKA